MTVYVVMSRSRQQRELVRRVWAGREAARRRLVFLTTEAEAGLAAEQREHDDLVVPSLGPDPGLVLHRFHYRLYNHGEGPY